MSRSILIGAATLAVAALVPQLPAMAQEPEAQITVRAPVVRAPERSGNGVNSPERLAAYALVSTSDLDLRTAYGRDVLAYRVRLAADQACDKLDAIDPPSAIGGAPSHDSGDCRHLAVKDARSQIRTVIALYG